MKTKIFKAFEITPTVEEDLKFASNVIKNGGLVVFPTETVYGLGADGTNAEAARKIYQAKGRPSDNPLIIHIATPEDASKYTYTNETYDLLAKAFMPGPITVVLPAKDMSLPARWDSAWRARGRVRAGGRCPCSASPDAPAWPRAAHSAPWPEHG